VVFSTIVIVAFGRLPRAAVRDGAVERTRDGMRLERAAEGGLPDVDVGSDVVRSAERASRQQDGEREAEAPRDDTSHGRDDGSEHASARRSPECLRSRAIRPGDADRAAGRNDGIRSEKFPPARRSPSPRRLLEEPAEVEEISLEPIDRGGGPVETALPSHRLEIDGPLPHARRPEVADRAAHAVSDLEDGLGVTAEEGGPELGDPKRDFRGEGGGQLVEELAVAVDAREEGVDIEVDPGAAHGRTRMLRGYEMATTKGGVRSILGLDMPPP